MMETSEVLAVAQCFLSRTLSQTESSVLGQLCGAAMDYWTAQLRDGVEPENCRGAFVAACAWTALAGMTGAGESASPSPVSFTAGDLTVHNRSSSASANVRNLRAQAEAIMAPFVRDGDFAFLEVAG